MTQVFVVGAGKVGLGMALSCRAAGVPVCGIWNRSPKGIEHAVRYFKHTRLAPMPWLSPGFAQASLILIALSDQALEGEHRAHHLLDGVLHHRKPEAIVAHCSGVLPASVLATTDAQQKLGSLHFLLPFSSPEEGAKAIEGALCALQSNDNAVATTLAEFAQALGAHPVRIDAAQKPRYHAAAVMASNLVVALLATADAELHALGMENSGTALAHLAYHAALQYGRLGNAALTGPLQRGDTATLEKHLAALSSDALPIYRMLSRKALAISSARSVHERDALERLLSS